MVLVRIYPEYWRKSKSVGLIERRWHWKVFLFPVFESPCSLKQVFEIKKCSITTLFSFIFHKQIITDMSICFRKKMGLSPTSLDNAETKGPFSLFSRLTKDKQSSVKSQMFSHKKNEHCSAKSLSKPLACLPGQSISSKTRWQVHPSFRGAHTIIRRQCQANVHSGWVQLAFCHWDVLLWLQKLKQCIQLPQQPRNHL